MPGFAGVDKPQSPSALLQVMMEEQHDVVQFSTKGRSERDCNCLDPDATGKMLLSPSVLALQSTPQNPTWYNKLLQVRNEVVATASDMLLWRLQRGQRGWLVLKAGIGTIVGIAWGILKLDLKKAFEAGTTEVHAEWLLLPAVLLVLLCLWWALWPTDPRLVGEFKSGFPRRTAMETSFANKTAPALWRGLIRQLLHVPLNREAAGVEQLPRRMSAEEARRIGRGMHDSETVTAALPLCPCLFVSRARISVRSGLVMATEVIRRFQVRQWPKGAIGWALCIWACPPPHRRGARAKALLAEPVVMRAATGATAPNAAAGQPAVAAGNPFAAAAAPQSMPHQMPQPQPMPHQMPQPPPAATVGGAKEDGMAHGQNVLASNSPDAAIEEEVPEPDDDVMEAAAPPEGDNSDLDHLVPGMPVPTKALNYTFNVFPTDAVHWVEYQRSYTTSAAFGIAVAITAFSFFGLGMLFAVSGEPGLSKMFLILFGVTLGLSALVAVLSVDRQLRIVMKRGLSFTTRVDSVHDAELIARAIFWHDGALYHDHQPLTCPGRIPAPGKDIVGALSILPEGLFFQSGYAGNCCCRDKVVRIAPQSRVMYMQLDGGKSPLQFLWEAVLTKLVGIVLSAIFFTASQGSMPTLNAILEWTPWAIILLQFVKYALCDRGVNWHVGAPLPTLEASGDPILDFTSREEVLGVSSAGLAAAFLPLEEASSLSLRHILQGKYWETQ